MPHSIMLSWELRDSAASSSQLASQSVSQPPSFSTQSQTDPEMKVKSLIEFPLESSHGGGTSRSRSDQNEDIKLQSPAEDLCGHFKDGHYFMFI